MSQNLIEFLYTAKIYSSIHLTQTRYQHLTLNDKEFENLTYFSYISDYFI